MPRNSRDYRCTATSKRSGKRCKRRAILGGTVCPMHGGSAPQVKAKAQKRLALADITPDKTLLEIARVAYGSVASMFTEDGRCKQPHELDEDQQALLAGFEACIKNVEAGDGQQDRVFKIKANDKIKALEMLAKYFGLLQEKVDHSGEISFRWADKEEEAV